MVASLVKEEMELRESLLWADSNDYERKPERHAELIKQINAKNAKFVAFALVLGFIIYHGIIHLRYVAGLAVCCTLCLFIIRQYINFIIRRYINLTL